MEKKEESDEIEEGKGKDGYMSDWSNDSLFAMHKKKSNEVCRYRMLSKSKMIEPKVRCFKKSH